VVFELEGLVGDMTGEATLFDVGRGGGMEKGREIGNEK
jgi:hypothetical protein